MAWFTSSYRRFAKAPRVALALLGLLALSLVPAAARAQQFVSYFEPSACPLPFPEEAPIDCGYVVVPESHNNFDGTVLRLAIATLRSPNPNKAADPLFFLAGGPGQAAIPLAGLVFEAYSQVLAQRDIVLIDQRGTGFSEPGLYCQNETAATRLGLFKLGTAAEDTPPEIQAVADTVSACLQQLTAAGVDLRYYNTTENAADLEDIRRALGYGQINLFGGSYGTRLALEALKYRSDTIRSTVLDSNVPPQSNYFTSPFDSFNGSLSRLIAACNADQACSSSFGDIGADYDAVVARLNAQPVVLPLIDLETEEIVDYIPITGVDFTYIIFTFMYGTSVIPIMPAIISLTADSDYEILSLLASILVLSPEGPFPTGMYFATACDEDAKFTTVDDFVRARDSNRRAAGLAYILSANEAVLGVCAASGLGRDDPSVNNAISSDVPSLLISGVFDPATPPEEAELVASTLSRGTLVSVPFGGHTPSTGSPCLQTAIAQFLANPSAAPDTSCLAAEAEPFLTLDGAQTTVAALKDSGKLLELVQQIK